MESQGSIDTREVIYPKFSEVILKLVYVDRPNLFGFGF